MQTSISLLGKTWNILNTDENLSLFEKLCKKRQLETEKSRNAFFNGKTDTHLKESYKLKDIEKATIRILKAIDNKERIIIYGDYDVDGVCSTAIMFTCLSHLGAEVSYRLPHRVNDGYGLHKHYIDECKEKDVKLIICVDCGTSNQEEIDYAKKHGIDSVIIDHHTVPKELPKQASAFVNPHQKSCTYPFNNLCAAGLCYKVAHYILDKKKDITFKRDELLLLAAIGTVADCVPLIEDNRHIVKEGIAILHKSKNKGLQEMLKIGKIDTNNTSTYTIGFQIGPRLNAAGRIHHAYSALHLLLEKKENAIILEELNTKRQQLLKKNLSEAEKQAHPFINNKEKVCIVYSNHWHIGVIGLIAGRLCEKYHLPTLVLQEKKDGSAYVGSARSIPSFNIIEALSEFRHYFTHFGGHAQAAGFALQKERLFDFIQDFSSYCRTRIKKEDTIPQLNIDCEIVASEINQETLNTINQFSPFGIGNPSPKFLLKNTRLTQIKQVGQDNKHIKCTIKHTQIDIPAIAFNFGNSYETMNNEDLYNLVIKISLNEWRGQKKIQAEIIDLHKTN